jgi:hypothetical protein
MKRPAYLILAACFAILGAVRSAGANEAWTLDKHTIGKNKSCSLSRMDQGRSFSVLLTLLSGNANQGLIGLAFDDAKLIQGANKALATLEFDNGTRQGHRIEVTPDGRLLVPIVALNLSDALKVFSESRTLTVATRFGSRSLDLDGIAARIPDLRACAGS